MHLRTPIKLALLCLAFSLIAPQLAHADTMGWDFTLFKYVHGAPDSPPGTQITETRHFTLSVWDIPTILGCDAPSVCVIQYGNITFYLDGIGIGGPPPQDFFPSGSLWTGDPNHPDFTIGLHGSSDIPGDTIDIVAIQTPEPSTIGLMGTGLLGLAGAFRRRLLLN